MKSRAHLLISGDVQGVFFRSFVRSESNVRDVKGWVKNLSDGRVEAVLEGDKDQVEKVIELCRRGPPVSVIEDVAIEWEKYTGGFKGFEIR
jgi:acylphosphatase